MSSSSGSILRSTWLLRPRPVASSPAELCFRTRCDPFLGRLVNGRSSPVVRSACSKYRLWRKQKRDVFSDIRFVCLRSSLNPPRKHFGRLNFPVKFVAGKSREETFPCGRAEICGLSDSRRGCACGRSLPLTPLTQRRPVPHLAGVRILTLWTKAAACRKCGVGVTGHRVVIKLPC